MIFGLMNAPFYFSKLMQKVLEPLCKDCVLLFLDDILIAGKNWKDLKTKLISVHIVLKNANLTLNLSKRFFLHKKELNI